MGVCVQCASHTLSTGEPGAESAGTGIPGTWRGCPLCSAAAGSAGLVASGAMKGCGGGQPGPGPGRGPPRMHEGPRLLRGRTAQS